jgi:hypothetical protein
MMAEAVIHPKLIQARLGRTAIRMTLNLYGGAAPPDDTVAVTLEASHAAGRTCSLSRAGAQA